MLASKSGRRFLVVLLIFSAGAVGWLLVSKDSPTADDVLDGYLQLHPGDASAAVKAVAQRVELNADGEIVHLDLRGATFTDRGLKHLSALTSIESLDCGQTRITDEGLEHLLPLGRLKRLNVEHCDLYGHDKFRSQPLTDVGFKTISKLQSLEGLSIGANAITDVGLRHLVSLTNLRTLDLRSSHQVTATGVKSLAELTALQRLVIDHCRLTDEGLLSLRPLTNLETLNLAGNDITDESLSALVDMSRLRSLNVSWCRSIRGPGLSSLSKLPSLSELGLEATGVDDNGLQAVRELAALEKLSVRYTKVSDAGLAHISGLTRLKDLDLYGEFFIRRSDVQSAITDEGLRHVGQISSLEKLDLGQRPITDDGLKFLSGLKNLRSLNLNRTEISDDGLVSLKALPLQDLDVGSTELTASAVDKVLGDSRVTRLSQSFCKNVDDESMKAVGQLMSLQTLDLAGTNVGDAGLAHLSGMSGLQSLGLGGGPQSLTASGVAKLRSALPNCKVVWTEEMNSGKASSLPAPVRLKQLE